MKLLRQELNGAQQRQAELLRWKLLLVSALAATGLGLTNSPTVPHIELILCCIPFVCAYVDILYYDQSLIIIGIAEFTRSCLTPDDENLGLIEYEKFALSLREIPYKNKTIGAYDLNKINLKWASIIFSVAIAIYAATQYHKSTSIAIFISGIIGILLSFWVTRSYEIRVKQIRELGNQRNTPVILQAESD